MIDVEKIAEFIKEKVDNYGFSVGVIDDHTISVGRTIYVDNGMGNHGYIDVEFVVEVWDDGTFKITPKIDGMDREEYEKYIDETSTFPNYNIYDPTSLQDVLEYAIDKQLIDYEERKILEDYIEGRNDDVDKLSEIVEKIINKAPIEDIQASNYIELLEMVADCVLYDSCYNDLTEVYAILYDTLEEIGLKEKQE